MASKANSPRPSAPTPGRRGGDACASGTLKNDCLAAEGRRHRSRRFSEAESLVDVPVIDDIVVVCPGLVATVSAAHQRQLNHVLDLGGIDRPALRAANHPTRGELLDEAHALDRLCMRDPQKAAIVDLGAFRSCSGPRFDPPRGAAAALHDALADLGHLSAEPLVTSEHRGGATRWGWEPLHAAERSARSQCEVGLLGRAARRGVLRLLLSACARLR